MPERAHLPRGLMLALLWAHAVASPNHAWALAPLPAPHASAPASAQHQVEAHASLQERANRLASELRCLVCQNQSIADSHAPLAIQLKQELQSQLASGASDESVRDFMVQRYGEFVLYRPPMTGHNLALWLGPLVILMLALGALLAAVRSHRLDGREHDEEDPLAGDVHDDEPCPVGPAPGLSRSRP